MSKIYIFVKGAFETNLRSNFKSLKKKRKLCFEKWRNYLYHLSGQGIFDVRIKISIINRLLEVKWTWLWAVIKEVQ